MGTGHRAFHYGFMPLSSTLSFLSYLCLLSLQKLYDTDVFLQRCWQVHVLFNYSKVKRSHTAASRCVRSSSVIWFMITFFLASWCNNARIKGNLNGKLPKFRGRHIFLQHPGSFTIFLVGFSQTNTQILSSVAKFFSLCCLFSLRDIFYTLNVGKCATKPAILIFFMSPR